LSAEPAQSPGPAPEQIERGIIDRSILRPADEDGTPCNPHVASIIQTQKREGPNEARGLARVHIQSRPPEKPPELHDVGRDSLGIGGPAAGEIDLNGRWIIRHTL
jgi:hypothetical protein